MPNLTGDSGIVTTVSTRPRVFAAGMPSSTASSDTGVATTVAARVDTCNPPTSASNPPSAPSDLGSA